jgi:AcrR family transcriptional regulator
MNAVSKRMDDRRSYDNSRRAAQADETASRIVEATIDLLAEAETELSVSAIASKAGVSAPSVYKHFPNRQAIFEAVQSRINERFGRPAWPKTGDEILQSVPQLHRFFSNNEQLVRAAVSAPQLRGFWEVTRKRRDDAISKALRDRTGGLASAHTRAIAAMVVRIVGVESWLELKDVWGLDDDTITNATLDALRAVLGSAGRRRGGTRS